MTKRNQIIHNSNAALFKPVRATAARDFDDEDIFLGDPVDVVLMPSNVYYLQVPETGQVFYTSAVEGVDFDF